MEIAIRAIGNSRGVVLPKPVLAQVGLLDADCAEMTVENGTIVLRRPCAPARARWAEAIRAVAGGQNDAPGTDVFGNADDVELAW